MCNEVVCEIINVGDADLSRDINYINVTFAHKIMVGEWFDKKKLKSEIKSFLINGKKQECDYVRKLEAKYSAIYPSNNIKVDLNSDMMYLVPRMQGIGIGDQDPVIRCIDKKEKKLNCYKEKCNDTVSKWWLCIEVPEDAYLNPQSYRLPEAFTSEYNKIVLVTKSIFGFGMHLIFQS